MLHAPALSYADLTDATPDDIVELHEAADRDVEDLTVQIRLLGQGPWHRKAVGGLTTACGEPIDYCYATSRLEKYGGILCRAGCFAAFELARCAENNDQEDR